MHLVRQAPRRDDGDPQILRITFDGAPESLSELVEAAGGWNGELQHAHLQRHDAHWPFRIVRAKHRERREAAMVQRPVLEERHVELVGHQRVPDVRGELRMSLDRRQIARTGAFIRHCPFGAHSQCERGVVVEEERGDVIVVNPQ